MTVLLVDLGEEASETISWLSLRESGQVVMVTQRRIGWHAAVPGACWTLMM
jgi:hypothetical protein